ncbi:nucleoside hydrolase [Paenibacillus sp. JNUCC31]|nr:nucleoside hydrolase [Paenibacillus sp. JNUCC-31]
MKLPYDVPQRKKIRLIMNTDAKNEADDQFAIVHALLTPRFIIKGLIAAHFGYQKSTTSMQDSYDEIQKVLTLMHIHGQVPVFKGAKERIFDERTPQPSEGAELIIREALSDDQAPLYAVFLGPLTDLASAYLIEPSIAGRLTALWIGGGHWPEGGGEYNLYNDIHAANVVFQSGIDLWQVPLTAYSTIRVTIAELALKVRPYGEIGRYLFDQLVNYNDLMAKMMPDIDWPKGESWCLGDSPAVSLLLDDHQFGYEMKPPPRFTEEMIYMHGQNGRQIRVYHYVDPRFTLEDMFAKLALQYGCR